MPPSLRLSVGDPPDVLTVTAPFIFNVSVTVLPLLASPFARRGAHTGDDRGVDVERESVIVGGRKIGFAAARAGDLRAMQVVAEHIEIGRVIAGLDLVVEDEVAFGQF